MKNEDLKAKYDEMHKQGPSAWFGQGEEERELILKMGAPWNRRILEIGCGEGEFASKIALDGTPVMAVDYSEKAIKKAKEKHRLYNLYFECCDYKSISQPNLPFDRIVMQGVLEHLDDPFKELKWMMDNLLTEHGDVITSSPCFLNPRGIVWMTLDLLGAVMSKTDLHFLNPNDFARFCALHKYGLSWDTCDYDWGCGAKMIEDFQKRLPLALKDGDIRFAYSKLNDFIHWLESNQFSTGGGATAVYKISK